ASFLLFLFSFPTRRSSDLDTLFPSSRLTSKYFDVISIHTAWQNVNTFLKQPISGKRNWIAVQSSMAPFGRNVFMASRRLPHRTRSEEHTSELQSRFDLVCS